MTRKPTSKPREVVTLADLSPRHQVTGGSERRVFGADAPVIQATEHMKERAMSGSKNKDLAPKTGETIKGGKNKARLAGNDNLTLVRAAKPAKKDLPPGKDVKGGKKRLAANDNLTLLRAMKAMK